MLDHNVLSSGFSDPVIASQSIFRCMLDAMANPGQIIQFDDFLTEAQTELPKSLAMIVLALADYETPLFLDQCFNSDICRNWITFHTGATIANESKQALFAVLSAKKWKYELAQFNLGEARYPDRSCTLLIACSDLSGGDSICLSGPGIEKTRTINPQGLEKPFWEMISESQSCFPLGLDVVLCSEMHILALPRTTRCIVEG